MPVIGAIVAAALGWLWWTGRIGKAHVLPIGFGLVGVLGILRGVAPMAVAGAVGCAFFLWKMGRDARVTPAQKLALARAEAEQLLALPPHYDMEMLDAAYRFAAKAAHPDAGGDAAQLAALTDARDLLKAHLLAPPQA